MWFIPSLMKVPKALAIVVKRKPTLLATILLIIIILTRNILSPEKGGGVGIMTHIDWFIKELCNAWL